MKNQKIVAYVWFMFVFAVGPFMMPVRADNEAEAYTNAELRENSVFAEAEDFVLPKGWSVVNGHGIDMYVPAVSCGKTVRNPVEGTATLNVTIPKDGTYSMILWFTKWAYDRSLELRVEQNGVIIASSKFGRPQDRQANWSYNVQVGEQTAPLKAGPARLLLYGPPFGSGVGSPVDCVLLTKLSLKKMDVKNAASVAGANFGYLLTSSGEQIDWHAFTPQCFVRFTILTTNTPAVTAKISSSWHHAPWGSRAPVIGDAAGKPVPQGTPSAWSDISEALDTDQAQATIWFMFKGAERMPSVWRLRLEIASQPAANAVLRVFEENWDDDAVGYVMSGNVPKYPDQIESVSAVTERHFNLLRNIFPLLPGGDNDLRPRVLSITSSDANRSPRLLIKEAQVLAMMGINALNIHAKPHQDAAAGAGMDFSKAEAQHFIHDIGLTECSFDPVRKSRLEKNLTDWAENMKKNEPIQFQNIRYVVLADEPGTPNGLTHITTCSRCQEAFRKWLQMRGATPQQLGVTNWDEIKAVMTDPKASLDQRRLGWLSSVFAQEITPLPFKNATEILQKTFGRPIGTRINFSDECVNGYGLTMSNGDGLNWFEFSRMAATTFPCTEDFISWNPHITGFVTDLLRSTATTRDLPLMLFITWGYAPPADPNSAALRTMSAVARGVKILYHYQYGPYYSSTECAFSEDGQYIKSVAYVNRVLGLADDILGKALVPAREVAILWSQATEQWKPDDAFTVERRMLHYALSMQQIPVDFLCEKDIPTRLAEYRVLYLPANNLPRDCVKPIADWVKEGGTLIVCGGGPERDEANEPSNSLWLTLGLTGVEMRKDALNYRGETEGLAHLKGTTEVKGVMGSHAIPVAGYKAVLAGVRDAKVLATYQEGGAAIIENRVGKGRAVSFGFNPGLSLLIAMDAAGCKTFWNVFPADELRLIAAPVTEAGVVAPVATQVGVDAARLDGPEGSVVTLANFTLKPVEKLLVLARGMNDVKKVVSCAQGTLAFKQTSEGIEIELPLQSVDVLKLYTKEKIIPE